MCKSIFAGLLLTAAALTVNGQSVFPGQKNYVSLFTTDSITIDGKGNERAWQNAAWSDAFIDIEGDAKPRPYLDTRMKMIWNNTCLFIFAELREPHLQASLRQRDTIIYADNDFEVFIDPNGDTHQYFEIEVNAFNTLMDLFMGKPYRNGGNAMLNWDVKGLRTAVQHYGTINQPRDKDSAWTVEMAIPFTALGLFRENMRPKDNTRWRINFSRVQWEWEVVNNRYQKKNRPEHNWVWSPQGIVDMHAPERWGNLWFRMQPGNSTATPSAEDESARRWLWDLYYRQQQYRRKQGKYATSLQALDMPAAKGNATLELEAISHQFNARVTNGASAWSIDQEGHIYER